MESTSITLGYIKGYCQNNNITLPDIDGMELVLYGKKELNIPKLHCFKNINNPCLERVNKLIGFMKTVYDASTVVDFGTQRGALLWPIMNAFPHIQYVAIDIDLDIINYLNCVRVGGANNLTILNSDITKNIPLNDSSADIVVASEILEHLSNPQLAANEAIRLASKYIYVTVPLKPDNNPEHIQLFTKESLTELFIHPKVSSINISYLPKQIVAIIEINK